MGADFAKPGISLVIPCLNEEKCIAHTIRSAREIFASNKLTGEILIVDNGCEDRTVEIARALGATVVHEPRRGYGQALRAGFESARHEIVITIDADLSYPLEEIPRLLAELSNGAELVLGNRLRGIIELNAMPTLNRYLGTPVLSWLIRRLHRVPTYDCNSGFRAIRRDHLRQLNLRSPGMELASEMLIRAGKSKLKYTEIIIPFRRDQRGVPSHLNRWRDGMRHLNLISRTIFS